jgi:hypothetical protein
MSQRNNIKTILNNVPHGRAAQRASRSLLPSPHQNLPYYGPKQLTLGLYSAVRPKVSFRDHFYVLLTRSRIVSSLIAPSTAPLGWLALCSARSLLCLLPITTRPKFL